MICRKCGNYVADSAKKCKFCKTPISERFENTQAKEMRLDGAEEDESLYQVLSNNPELVEELKKQNRKQQRRKRLRKYLLQKVVATIIGISILGYCGYKMGFQELKRSILLKMLGDSYQEEQIYQDMENQFSRNDDMNGMQNDGVGNEDLEQENLNPDLADIPHVCFSNGEVLEVQITERSEWQQLSDKYVSVFTGEENMSYEEAQYQDWDEIVDFFDRSRIPREQQGEFTCYGKRVYYGYYREKEVDYTELKAFISLDQDEMLLITISKDASLSSEEVETLIKKYVPQS